MEAKTKNALILGVAFCFGMWAITGFQIPDIGGAPASVLVGQGCDIPGEIKTIACTTSTGLAGVMEATCDPYSRTWTGVCKAKQTTATTLPASTQILCNEEYVSYTVEVGDSLDEEAKPKTLLAETVRIVSSTGQELTKSNTSASGPTTFQIPCKQDTVTFMTTGDDIYTSEIAILGGQTYNGAVPTYSMSGSVPVALNLEPVYIPVKKLGNISATIWNDDRTAANTGNITLDASGDTGSKIHFKVEENADDQAAQGVIVLFDYTRSMVRKIEVEGYTAGCTAQKDSEQVINDYSHYEEAWRLYRNNQPLTLDRDSRTDDPQEAEFVVRITATSTNPLMNFTIQPIDSDRFLKASGSQIVWAYGGQFRGEDDDLVNVGISSTYEHNTSPVLEVN